MTESIDALRELLALRRGLPAVQADLADPFRRQWAYESTVGQYLGVSRETLRQLDALCWSRRDPTVLISVPDLVTEYGRQLAALLTLALYLQEFSGVTPEELWRSFLAACEVSEEATDE